MVQIDLNRIYKAYDGAESYSVTDFNLNIEDKEFIVFVGPSGCGKSTTLRMIAGLEDITEGELIIDGKVMNDVEPKDRDIAMVFQNYALYPHMSVFNNMAFGLKLRKYPKQEIKERVEKAAEILGLTEYLHRKPSALSGGQRQRVALGRAIVRDAKVFLMDEPLSNLDARLRIEMREEIRRIQQETGITTVFVTHDQEEALSIADNVMVLNDGHIQQMTDPVSLYRQPANLFVANFIGTPVINKFTRQSKSLNQHHHLMNEEWHTLGIRPEYIQLSNESDHLIQAHVKRVEIVGKDQTVHLEFQGEEIIASDLSGELEEDTLVYLTADPEGILLFDKDGKKLDKAATTDIEVGNSDDE